MAYVPMLDSGTGVKVGSGYKPPVTQHRQTNLQPKKIPSTAPRFNPPTTVSSSSNNPASYNSVPVSGGGGGGVSVPKPPAQASSAGVTSWIDELKKNLSGNQPKGPKLPAQIDLNRYAPPPEIDLDQYRTENATIEDIARKYGFDYSREYADRQAEAIAQAQRAEVESARERAAYETQAAQTNLQHDFFQRYLQQRQDLANSGLNAGIASERNLRLDMNRQHALADILANAQLYNQELDRRSGVIDAEALAYADRLYNERLQQGFGNAMEYTSQQRQENQAMLQAAQQQRSQIAQERQQMLQAALTQRSQQVQEAWREFEWNNMSMADRQKLIADAERFGMEMAWERHKFDASMQFEAGLSGFNNAGGGGGNTSAPAYPPTSFQTSKGIPPTSFQSHLSTAIQRTGVPSSWIQPLSQLVANESTWNPKAKNPNSTAHGYAQFLNSTRQQYEKKTGLSYNDPVNQLVMMIHYVKDRYGSAQNAINFWNKNKWY